MSLLVCSESASELTHVLVIAGLNTAMFDRIRKESARRFVPDGHLVSAPITQKGYSHSYINRLIGQTHDYAAKLAETNRLSTLLLNVDFKDQSTTDLLEAFFPYSLPMKISYPDAITGNTQQIAVALNKFTEILVRQSINLRSVSRIISEHTNVHNLTPLLLPVKNFKSKILSEMLWNLYQSLASAEYPATAVQSAISMFLAEHPRARQQDDRQHCFYDGTHYFKSPGRHRHGFFRNDKSEHHIQTCLLNARSRLGGVYDHSFHYDCTASNGSLRKEYENYHGKFSPPGKNHVNICPNDYVI